MKKILIINSPLFRDKNPSYDEDSLPPLGLGYIATYLKKNGHSVSLIDAVADNITLTNLIGKVHTQNPNVLAINIFTTNYDIVKDFICNTKDFRIHIIIGGLSTKFLYKEIIKWQIDNKTDIVFGDSEFFINDLVEFKPRNKPILSSGNKNVYNIDKNSYYFVKDISEVELDRSFFSNEPILNFYGHKEANIITSRGCIFNCAFCSAARSINSEYTIREKSSESIIAELHHLAKIYQDLTSVRVLDDLFLRNSHTIEKATNIFNHFNLKWRSMSHVQTFKGVSQKILNELKQSGCLELFIGIDSGSPKILKKIHKSSNLQLIKENLIKLLKTGIAIKGYFIYGFPDETEEDLKMTFELAYFLKQKSLKYGTSFRTSAFEFRPYHGTELFSYVQEKKDNIEKFKSIEPNKKLSDLVGRVQFNFHSGNYSDVDINSIHKYIYKTIRLNSL